uniref:cDNA FLJ20154 fis, clone COL08740 n=1 Tax=Homo sapiens TaxID=9606 RepID=Q9NXM7_HUMAN|nr:unnamed protein product [Homo sapiens]
MSKNRQIQGCEVNECLHLDSTKPKSMLNKVKSVHSGFLGEPCVSVCCVCASSPVFLRRYFEWQPFSPREPHVWSTDRPLKVIDLTHLLFTEQMSDCVLGCTPQHCRLQSPVFARDTVLEVEVLLYSSLRFAHCSVDTRRPAFCSL